MATPDDDIDRLYQGPLDAFTSARNALAKSLRRPELKKLEKPSLPAWAINQLYWHHRPAFDQLIAAADTLLQQHQRLLSGGRAEIQKAEQTHRDAVRQALATAKQVLRANGHPDTAVTLDAVRNTLQALPAPEAQGRLTRPLAPRGLEALAGLVMAAPRPARDGGPPSSAPAVETAAPAAQEDSAAVRRREAARFGGRARAEREAARDAERVRQRAEEERAERQQARRRDAAAVLAAARAELARAEAAVTAADRAYEQAGRELQARRAERDAADAARQRAQRLSDAADGE